MKFYDREDELKMLRDCEAAAAVSARLTVLMGRRRIGKTTLLKNAFTINPTLYFFVAKKSEILLCEEFTREAEEKLDIVLGEFRSFALLFKALMLISRERAFTLIIDEFQELANINPALFSEMQNVWDSHKDASRLNAVFCGSIYSMMKKIFENAREPLFGRMTHRMVLKSFSTTTLKQIIGDHAPDYTAEDLLAFYSLTGGIAKYVEQFVINRAFTKKAMLECIFQPDSFFLDEGRAVLINEFGKDYGTYFSILSLISSSKTERSDIENTLQITVGGHLERLEKDYSIISRRRPLGNVKGGRFNKYSIDDNFLNFWFRFIFKHRSAIEIGNLDYVRRIVERDYEAFSGIMLERYFREQLIESKVFSDIGSFWDRKGGNEIDLVAVNDLEKKLHFYEVKRSRSRFKPAALERKAEVIVRRYPDYAVSYQVLSLADM